MKSRQELFNEWQKGYKKAVAVKAVNYYETFVEYLMDCYDEVNIETLTDQEKEIVEDCRIEAVLSQVMLENNIPRTELKEYKAELKKAIPKYLEQITDFTII